MLSFAFGRASAHLQDSTSAGALQSPFKTASVPLTAGGEKPKETTDNRGRPASDPDTAFPETAIKLLYLA